MLSESSSPSNSAGIVCSQCASGKGNRLDIGSSAPMYRNKGIFWEGGLKQVTGADPWETLWSSEDQVS